MNALDAINAWVDDYDSFYFFLPDGPYGRPFDNQYSIDKIEMDEVGLNIYFKEGVVFCFYGDVEVMEDYDKLIISKFTKFKFEDISEAARYYDYGEVTLTRF
ncbi:hypothetical protein [Dickeya chrysanthemi]|uniref:CDI immunity protein domain-containing protein n=1 Tax=Dickeya chrysanthemi TaxID=556 RepID=A0ABU8JSI7_DICCH|nr:hypothetical protein [Dickeya chrysanthemi]MBX9447884.1 hypothetical protein [Dickeya chrysanthemi]